MTPDERKKLERRKTALGFAYQIMGENMGKYSSSLYGSFDGEMLYIYEAMDEIKDIHGEIKRLLDKEAEHGQGNT